MSNSNKSRRQAAAPSVRSRKLTARVMSASKTGGIKLAELVGDPSTTTVLERQNLAQLSNIRRMIAERKALTV